MAESRTLNHTNVTDKTSGTMAMISIIGGNLLVVLILLMLYILF